MGLTLADIEDVDRARCQEVGDGARYLGLQGVIAPSATQVGLVIAAFERNISRGQLIVTGTQPLDAILRGQQIDNV